MIRNRDYYYQLSILIDRLLIVAMVTFSAHNFKKQID